MAPLLYRLAGFPLTAQRLVLLGVDHFRKPENRLYAQGSLERDDVGVAA